MPREVERARDFRLYRVRRGVECRIETLAAQGPIESFPPTLIFLSTVDATVSTDAVVDNLLEHLAPGRHELVLFDINRNKVNSTILVSDPGPLTTRRRGWAAASSSSSWRVPSVDPPSATTISVGGTVWARSESTRAPMLARSLRAGVTTETFMTRSLSPVRKLREAYSSGTVQVPASGLPLPSTTL